MDKKKSKAEASRKGTSKKTESEKESVTATVTITDSIVEDDQQVVDNKPIKIRVNAVENLKEVSVKFKVEHADNTLGESDTIVLQEDDETIINFETILWCDPSNLESIDKVTANPILFSIIECAGEPASASTTNTKGLKPGKEKKIPKEESLNVLGQCNLDLLPLALGEENIQEMLLVHMSSKLVPQNKSTWPKVPCLSVSASIEEPFFSPEQFEDINILYLTLGSMYNLPYTFNENMQFSAATAFPMQTKVLEPIYFKNGIFKMKREIDKSKRWAGLTNIQGKSCHSLYTMGNEAVKSTLSLNMQFKENEDTPRIEWNVLRRCFINKQASDSIFEVLSRYRCWALEILVVEQQGTALSGSSSKSKTREPLSNRMHYIAYPDFTTLLYPGVTKARSAAQLFTYTQEDVLAKFGLQKPLFEDPMPEIVNKESSSIAKSKKLDSKSSSKDKKSDHKSSSKAATPVPVPSLPIVEESTPVFKEEGEPVFIIMEVEIFKPLVKKRELKQVETGISEIIPSRPEFSKIVMSATLAEKHFSQCIETVASKLANEYRKFVHQSNTEINNGDIQTNFFFHLTNFGVFEELKALLRNKISVLLGETSDSNTFLNLKKEKYISSVYTYLIEKMHTTMNSMFEGFHHPIEDPYSLSSDQLYFFAMEADEENMYYIANNFLLQRVLENSSNVDFWLDYAIFQLKNGYFEKSKESIKEALSLNIRHQTGLLMYAVLLVQTEEYRVAQVFFEALTMFYPDFTEGWVTFHLFFLKIENYVGADVTLAISKRCFEENKRLQPCVSSESLLWCTSIYSNDSFYLTTAISLIKLNLYEFAEMALAQELIYHNRSVPYLYYLSVLHYFEEKYEDAIIHVTEAVKQHGKDYSLWSLMGHAHYKLGNKQQAMDCYQHVVDSFDRPNDIHFVELRLGNYYLEDQNYETARALLLDACKFTPSPATWFGVGVACYMMEDFTEAEQALMEANILDNTRPCIWGYLTLVNLRCEHQFEFEQCFRQCVKLGLNDEAILEEITMLQKRFNYPDPVPLIF